MRMESGWWNSAQFTSEEHSFHTKISTSWHGNLPTKGIKTDRPLHDQRYLAAVTYVGQREEGSWHWQWSRYGLAELRVKLRKIWGKRPGKQRFDVKKIQNPKARSTFVLHLKKKFQALADLEDYTHSDQKEVIIKREEVKTALLQTSKAGLGTRERKKEWIPAETRWHLKKQFIEANSEKLKERHKQQCQEADRKVKKLATAADKRAFIDDLGRQAEDASSKGEQGKMHKITKVGCGKYHGPTDTPVRDNPGWLLTSEAEIDTGWAEHISEVLNRLPQTAEADVIIIIEQCTEWQRQFYINF